MLKKEIKILIADDHAQTATFVSGVLEFKGFKTFQAYNPKDTVSLCKKEKPDLLIFDMKMEDMAGCKITHELPNQKILFMVRSGEKAESCRNSIGTIEKPVDPTELVSKIKKEFKIED